uniref:Uncharacterized protein n=1 Tax=Tetranychus urticae TaxID=32264 RepID=T1KQC7_TETUR
MCFWALLVKRQFPTMVLDDGYEQPIRATNTVVNPTQVSTQVTDGVESGKTVSVSTCQCCGKESKPIVGRQNKYTWKYLTDIKTLRGRKYRQHVDSSSRGSTPVEGDSSSNGKYERCTNSATSQSRKVSPISWKSTSTSNVKGLQFKGCHVCNRSRPYSFSSSRTNSLSTKNDTDCPYSIVLGSLHPILHSYKPNYRSTGNVNRSTRKDETRRSLIMIFTITSILLFLMISYYGTIIYLRVKNSKLQ